jgi:hypothetical protein
MFAFFLLSVLLFIRLLAASSSSRAKRYAFEEIILE